MLLSGGVDSTVCAALLHKALKEDQVIAVHVDNGFMRKNESAKVEESLKALGLKVRGEWASKWRSPSRPWASKSEVSECQSGGVPQGLGPRSQRWVSVKVEESLKALGLKVRGEWVPKWRSPSRPWASKSEVSDAAEEWGCGRFWGWLEKCRLPHGLWASIKSVNYINNFI